ncbi:hypothetical protein, partial [Burkholderia sp. SRS-W-2-2016]|uniref:hypothetical protein n=1 Tax=Burkholderia sp. SRS-W-2-2016 TaxID=1926878 RepID=UPI001C4CA0E3
FRQTNLPLILCEAFDTFAIQQTPKNPPLHSASSAHTYRLLIFKDRFAYFAAPWRCFVCVAASAAEKRDYEELSSNRQQVFINFLTRLRR